MSKFKGAVAVVKNQEGHDPVTSSQGRKPQHEVNEQSTMVTWDPAPDASRPLSISDTETFKISS